MIIDSCQKHLTSHQTPSNRDLTFLTHIYFRLLEKKLSYGPITFISKSLMYDQIKHINNFKGMRFLSVNKATIQGAPKVCVVA